MIEIVKYKNNMNYEWDSFIDTSINGTIFHRRSFLSYHIDRKFEDASLIFKKRGQIISVFPAAVGPVIKTALRNSPSSEKHIVQF